MKQMRRKKSFFVFVVLIVFVLTQSVLSQQKEQEEELPQLVFDDGIAGKLEMEVHYGYWTLDVFKGLFEDDLIREFADVIADEIRIEVKNSGHNVVKVSHDHNLVFGSSGSVFGFELRFYPGGRYSSFSLGVSIEKTHMEAIAEGPVNVQFSDGSSAEMDAVGVVELNPLFTNLSFRWDIKPDWVVTPYFVLGLGVAALNGEVSYHYNGTYYWAKGTEYHEGKDVRDIKEVEEEPEIDINLPNILPLLQINIGVRAEVIPHLHLRAEAGIWDGIILRAGIAYKF
ncbi:MAG: hypothetical protein JSV17_14415 [Candidatus Aminicenantes bacterium]|nr:MAG: hypothetical protein JSV17_14415 [Candidatus Aminicenantes bacterium]